MSVASRVSTPVSVGRFVASIRAVAASSDGLVACNECRRDMSNMAETCPHCGSAAIPTASVDGGHGIDETIGVMRMSRGDAGAISFVVLGLAAVAYAALRVAG